MNQILTIKDVQNNLGSYCRKLRKNNGLTQEELADQLAMSRLTVSKLERGENFTIETFLKIVQHFGKMHELNDFISDKTEIPQSLY